MCSALPMNPPAGCFAPPAAIKSASSGIQTHLFALGVIKVTTSSSASAVYFIYFFLEGVSPSSPVERFDFCHVSPAAAF